MDLFPLVLGSALLASLITGVVTIVTTALLVSDQKRARTDAAARVEAEKRHASLAYESAAFLDHFVRDGLEGLAADLDTLAHVVDLAYFAARWNRDIVQGVRADTSSSALTSGGRSQIVEIGRALRTVPISAHGLRQARLIPFPGDFMQSMLTFNRCIALAADWCERYPWTRDDKLPTLDRYLQDLRTTLAAAARNLQAAAVVARQMAPMPYLDWFPIVHEDPKLIAIAADLKALVDRQLGGAPRQD